MSWEGFTQWLTDVSNNPVFISLTTIFGVGGCAWVILGRTSFGKKMINKALDLASGLKRDFSETKKKVEATCKLVDEKLVEIENKKNEIEKMVNNKIETFYNQFEFYETQIIGVLKLIPNSKVQEAVDKMIEDWADKKKEIECFVCVSYSEVMDELEKMKKTIEELENGRNDNQTKEE